MAQPHFGMDQVESAAPALFERASIQWEMSERRPHVAPFYHALSALRRAHPAFTRGTVRWLENAGETRVLSFERATAAEWLVVVANLSGTSWSGEVKTVGTYVDITPAAARSGGTRPVSLPAVTLTPWEFRVFRRATP